MEAGEEAVGGGEGGDEYGEGDGAGGDGGVVCAAQRAEFAEIRSGELRDGVRFEIAGVATSQKFLLSHAKSGSCLWGMFVGAEPVQGEPSGLLVVSFGAPAPAEMSCSAGTDGIPDDAAPGDAVRVVGRYSEFAPESCSGAAREPQLLVDVGCPVVRDGRGALPEPVVLSVATADAIASGSDAKLLRRYAGGLVRLEGLSGLPAADGEGVVAPYGVLRFAETRLEAHNDIAYGDLDGAGPGASGKSLIFPHPTQFARMIGLIHLDYCTWSLALRDPCGDIDPPSANCDG